MAEKCMTVKEWLMRAREFKIELEDLRAAKQEAFDLATQITAECGGGEVVQTSKKNTMEKKFITYSDYDNAINKTVSKLFAAQHEILNAINKLNNPTYKTLLRKYYIRGKTWEQVASEMHYSRMHICRMHGTALLELKDVIECYINPVI